MLPVRSLASLMLGLFFCNTLSAQVIFSEIMYNPDGGSEADREWVEIFNTGASTVDLSGWTFEDFQDSDVATPIPNGTMLDPGEALVLTPNFSVFDDVWGRRINRIQLGDFPNLANSPSSTNEIIALRNNSGVIQDFVNYDDENGWPDDISDGPSIYVLPDFLTASGNDTGTHWFSSTPGVDGAIYSKLSPFGEKASAGFVATQTTVWPAFTPSPDAAWSMVVFPDTQNYVKTQAHLPQFVDMAEWVRDNRAAFGIELVIQEGDIVNKNSNENPSTGENPSTLQWQNARNTMGILDGHVPYIMTVGNHDTGINNAENTTTRLNDFFSASDNPLNDPAQGGILKGVKDVGRLENAYFELTAPDGRNLLIFSLAWDPQPATLNWANQVAGQAKYDDFTAMLVTHNYLDPDSTRNSQGETIWNDFVSENGNFEAVFNGHIDGDGTGYLESTGDAGNKVHQMSFNTQFEGNGGNGWIRLLEFLDDGKTVRVRTYSPTYGFIRDDTENAFTFELTPLFGILPGDFNEDGVVDAADYTVYRDNLGTSNVLPNNGGLGTPIGSTYYDLWVDNFGNTSAANTESVPEPTSATLLVLLGFFMSNCLRNRMNH